MGFFSDAFSNKSMSSHELFTEIYGGRKSSSGKTVNVTTAIQVSAVFACCRVIGEGIAQVPLKLMRDTEGSKIEAKQHNLYKKMHLKPNRWQTSFEYRELIAWHIVLTGNHFSFINRVGRKIIELYPLEPKNVTVKFDKGVITYDVTSDDGNTKNFPASSIWHVRGPSYNGWYGLEAVQQAREAIGLSMATEESAARLHKNGANPSGTYSVEGTLTSDGYKQLSTWIEQNVSGAENAGKPLILDRAAKWVSTQMSGADAESMEQRRFQVEEICRFARVMPIMVGHADKTATYASAEQMFLAHVVHTLAPWYERLEQSMNINLLTEKEQDEGYYFNFVEEGLLRGSLTDTKDTILGYTNGGILTPNEGRAKLDLNPDPDPASDKLRIPANIVGSVPDEQGTTINE